MDQVEFLPISVSADHRYVHHDGRQWCGEHCIQYHSYLTSENQNLLDAMAFAYADSIALGLKKGHPISRRKSGSAKGGFGWTRDDERRVY